MHNTVAGQIVIPFIYQLIKPKSVLDVGCGLGTWLKVAKECGVEKTTGIDGNRAPQEIMQISELEFLEFDLTKPIILGEKYDLAICLEVAEHLPESAADILINTLVKNSNCILFSAAIPGQGGQNHINEQWPSYWQKKFESHEFYAFDILRQKFWDNKNIEWWYKQNMLIYSKKEMTGLFKTPTDCVPSLVHPELFTDIIEKKAIMANQVDSLETTVRTHLWKPRFLPSLKNLIKSIFKI